MSLLPPAGTLPNHTVAAASAASHVHPMIEASSGIMKPLISRRALGKAAAALGMLAMPALARAAPGLRIGYQKNGSLVILRQQDRLGALGVPVQWVEFPSGPLMLEALNAGAIDFGATGDTPPIFAQAAGSALVYVGAQPNSGANEALLVQEKGPVNSLADLRGKRIAFTKGSSSHYLVIKALAAAGMKLSDVQPVYLQPPDGGRRLPLRRGGCVVGLGPVLRHRPAGARRARADQRRRRRADQRLLPRRPKLRPAPARPGAGAAGRHQCRSRLGPRQPGRPGRHADGDHRRPAPRPTPGRAPRIIHRAANG